MNRMVVREYCRNDSQFGFELEFKDERGPMVRKEASASASHALGGKEDSVIVILFDSEARRDEVLKVINMQIKGLMAIACDLVNPVGRM